MKTIDSSLPLSLQIPSQSCDPTSIVLRYTDTPVADNTSPTTPPVQLASDCSRLDLGSSNLGYRCDVKLVGGVCWTPYRLQLAYNNAGGQSPFSSLSDPLPVVTEGN